MNLTPFPFGNDLLSCMSNFMAQQIRYHLSHDGMQVSYGHLVLCGGCLWKGVKIYSNTLRVWAAGPGFVATPSVTDILGSH